MSLRTRLSSIASRLEVDSATRAEWVGHDLSGVEECLVRYFAGLLKAIVVFCAMNM